MEFYKFRDKATFDILMNISHNHLQFKRMLKDKTLI